MLNIHLRTLERLIGVLGDQKFKLFNLVRFLNVRKIQPAHFFIRNSSVLKPRRLRKLFCLSFFHYNFEGTVTNFEKDLFIKQPLTYKHSFKVLNLTFQWFFIQVWSLQFTSQELIIVLYFKKNVEYSKSQKAKKLWCWGLTLVSY